VRWATFNLHAGVDGWGRPTRALEAAIALGADVLIAPETWRGEREDHVARLEAAGYRGHFEPLAEAERVEASDARRGWQPWSAHLTGEHGLFFTEHRELTARQRAYRRHARVERGTWGLALMTRLPLVDLEVVALERLARERVRRAMLVATLELDGRPIRVVALHGAHLSHGSYRQYRRVREVVEGLDVATPTLLGGDFNAWRPAVRLFLPGWTHLVAARTWPAARPHSQIDHLLGRGPWVAHGGGAVDAGSDHRALYVDLDLARP
jgi:endonuclease/exonuclease/phosphatase (EEP) superfamily protein YafD